MQYDMHFFGTYAIAYSAGIPAPDAHVIATSAQLVDDNSLTSLHTLESGEAVMGVATAHHPIDAGKRAISGGSDDDSRMIWVPFHFLPGAEGDTLHDRLICVKNGEVAQKMANYYTEKETIDSHREHALQLIGIAAHVYADTFSHYGFSGITSPLNSVDTDTIKVDEAHDKGVANYILKKAASFRESIAAVVANYVQLGHGSVATYPDRPYLRWSYLDPQGKRLTRDNPATFLEGCRWLHGMFSRFREGYYGSASRPLASFDAIEEAVKGILSTEADAPGRIKAWCDALTSGRFGAVTPAPTYSENEWTDTLRQARSFEYDQQTGRVRSDAYQFFAAADYHRNYVLKRLLPSKGLFVA